MTDSTIHPRHLLGSLLTGEVLEVGPGHEPFPTGAGAHVTFADRSVPGGRDATWPELVGSPHGPNADVDINLDSDGLRLFADATFDGVVASHVIEHTANPLAVLAEFHRVLKPGGYLVLVVPDRHLTFDAPRRPTPYSHVRREFEAGVTEVQEEHIREFCAAIYSQPPIHPPTVRAWHDPSKLDPSMLDLHRRRSVHAHCWSPEEFAALVATSILDGIASWRLKELYFAEDLPEPQPIEFGLALERAPVAIGPAECCREFIGRWRTLTAGRHATAPRRIADFAAALDRDLIAQFAVGLPNRHDGVTGQAPDLPGGGTPRR